MTNKPQRALPSPLPVTDTIPNAARIFYGVEEKGKAYRLARAGAIVTLDVGPRGKVALMHPTARLVGIDPNNL